jgi:endonuclease-3
MRLVPETWDAAMLDEHHSLVKLHAQTLCTFSEPKCEGCPLLKICPTGQRNVAELTLTAPPGLADGLH